MELQHFPHPKHLLVYNNDGKQGYFCYGCQEPILGPSYSCIECNWFYHHKSCVELPILFHHPLHPIHPFILFHKETYYSEDKEFSQCKLCKESFNEYTYWCSHYHFNLHIRCASSLLTMEAKVHDHPLTLIWM